MRLWTLHPRYLDDASLRDAWRDGLTARRKLRDHPRRAADDPVLALFVATGKPLAAIDAYLRLIHHVARQRGKSFDASLLGRDGEGARVGITSQHVHRDVQDLLDILATRDPGRHQQLSDLRRPHCHPVFRRGSAGRELPPAAL